MVRLVEEEKGMTSSLLARKIKLPRALPPVLGVGAYLKNALCLIQGDEAWISRENGSLDNVDAINRFQETAQEMIAAAAFPPVAVAHDWHPDFPCTRWAAETGLRCEGVQHHHAHGAALMAEHGLEAPVLCLALDGFGLGERNEAWGGELLLIDETGFRRLGHLKPMPQPGGDIAARQPWRMGAAALWAMGRGAEIAERYKDFSGAATLPVMMERGLNAPLTSSAGRLFDAACGLLDVKLMAAFEGEAPMELERIAAESSRESRIDPSLWRIDSVDDVLVLDMLPLLEKISRVQASEGAVLFHDIFAAALTDLAARAAESKRIGKITMGGGCFFNKRLRERVRDGIMAAGLDPFLPQKMSAGDTSVALGQAYAAALKIEKEG